MGDYLRGSRGGGGLFNLEKMIVSVLRKGLVYKVEKVKYKKLECCSQGSEKNLNFELVNKPCRISPHKVLQS